MVRPEAAVESTDFWGDDLGISHLEDAIDKAGERWELLHDAVSMGPVVDIHLFLQRVQVGQSLMKNVAYEKIGPADHESLVTYLNLSTMLKTQEKLNDEEILETVEGAARAFYALYSVPAREFMEPTDPEKARFIARAISKAREIAWGIAH